MGDVARAVEHLEEAVDSFREEDYAGSPLRPGHMVHGLLARVLAERGFPERAEAEIQRAIDVIERSDSPQDRCGGWAVCAFDYAYLRDARSAARCIERAYALDLADRPGYAVHIAEVCSAWARAMLGEPEPAVAELRQAIDAVTASGSTFGLRRSLGMLAEAELLAGRAAEGLATLDKAIAANPEDRILLPELLRLRGELRAACGAEPAAVESDLREAVALAREMGARLSELRAATSLARQLAHRGRATEGRELLAPLYAAFTEGFGARDLVEAKALLDEFG